MGSTFGRLFRMTTYGESHGEALGVVLDGCPAELSVSTEAIQAQLDRRRPGQSKITTPRKEADRVRILSGVYKGKTLGTSIGMLIENQDQQSTAYDEMKDLYRPGHADFTYDQRYGFRDWRGGGRASNRETAARVAAGAVAGLLIEELAGIKTLAWVERVKNIEADVKMEEVTLEMIEKNPVRCPDEKAAEKMIQAIEKAKKEGNSLGGALRFYVSPCIAGLGSPVFDKLTADLAKALMSIPASRFVEFGMGTESILLTGLEHNDLFVLKQNDRIGTETNRAGGVLGGISDGEPLWGMVGFKPTATILSPQKTVTQDHKYTEFKGKGRHDPCVLPRAVPIAEAMINLVLADHLLEYSIANLERLKKIFG